MAELKITFPKLKCFSKYETITSTKSTASHQRTLANDNPTTNNRDTLLDRLTNIRVKYVNKYHPPHSEVQPTSVIAITHNSPSHPTRTAPPTKQFKSTWATKAKTSIKKCF